jgi:hypothetical protein
MLEIEKLQRHPNYIKYQMHYEEFIRQGGVVSGLIPILDEFDDFAGTANGQYFHQDLLVASRIFLDKPERHVDVGSRIDGFVAHVASFRKIEILDIRDLEETGHENIVFFKADLTSEDFNMDSITDSISCLHALEHFGGPVSNCHFTSHGAQAWKV